MYKETKPYLAYADTIADTFKSHPEVDAKKLDGYFYNLQFAVWDERKPTSFTAKNNWKISYPVMYMPEKALSA